MNAFRKTRGMGPSCSAVLIVGLALAASAFADTPQADKLPSSTNPQVRAVVDRMGGRLTELETRQAKQDEILDVQKEALEVVNKAIDAQYDFATTVAAENKTLRENLEAAEADRDAARRGKWRAVGTAAGVSLLLGLVIGFVARGAPGGGGVVVGIPVTGSADGGSGPKLSRPESDQGMAFESKAVPGGMEHSYTIPSAPKERTSKVAKKATSKR